MSSDVPVAGAKASAPVSADDVQQDALYHLATGQEWASYQQEGRIAPPSLELEGFVHCSWGRQVAGTVARHFSGVAGLLALEVDPAELGATELVEEDSSGAGQAYPHAYGPIPAAAVVAAVPLA